MLIFSIDQVGWLNNDRSQLNAMTFTSVQRHRQCESWQDVENDFCGKSIKVGINRSSCKRVATQTTGAATALISRSPAKEICGLARVLEFHA